MRNTSTESSGLRRRTRRSGSTACRRSSTQLIDWQDIERKIAEQFEIELGPKDLFGRWIKDLLGRALRDERALLVVDNLERVQDAEQALTRTRELGFEKPHRLLAVSRKAVGRAPSL